MLWIEGLGCVWLIYVVGLSATDFQPGIGFIWLVNSAICKSDLRRRGDNLKLTAYLMQFLLLE